ncbi:MAG: hypothetical protein WCT44_02280 [Candidatus Paceibacterota bacterium]
MKKILNLIKKSTAVFMLLAFSVSTFGNGAMNIAHAVATPNWDVTGSYVINMEYQGTQYPHDLSLVQDNVGNLTGNGGSPAGGNVYTYDLTSGLVDGDTIDFLASYTATPDAVTPQTIMHVMGTIAEDGTISGTWTDNYQGGERSGAVSTVSGNAVSVGSMDAEDFGVMDSSGVKGYTAGFGLNDATFAGATSVVIKLYSDATLLQTNTLSGPNAALIIGDQISSPFDVFGTFDYAADGYWVNVRGAEYGQTLIPTKVTATATLENGKVVTAENTNLTGDPETIFPASGNVTTNAATAITSSDATLNGMNNENAAIGHSFWASLSPFSTESPTLPSGVYSTPDLGAINADTSFSASLSSVSGLPAITENTTYYFAAWTNVDGTWYPGAVLSFNTGDNTIGGEVIPGNGELEVTSVETIDSSATANGTFEDGWEYVFNITVPTDETHLAMKFADWAKTGGGGTIAAANNIRISSPQADNAGATVLITAANTYSSPTLNMITDLNPSMDGIQVKVTVETSIPVGSATGAYTTSYGVLTN